MKENKVQKKKSKRGKRRVNDNKLINELKDKKRVNVLGKVQ